ncbi:hypothetical protein [Naasia lichenicola]|uniref:Uncharacterized protein n=1 Tax=Naasia lichenicola TaxID=2565933 RepID=A0A4S4FLH3_9MICO|nr:hypothetical protein [Naasia lichenicola]THG30742.1 hypothetical protein E6C64_08875 [Naasia lichenicola]THG31979.1 hypothetical protein E6C64_08020 [Naasia lichenicola]
MSTPESTPQEPTDDVEEQSTKAKSVDEDDDVSGHFSFQPNHHLDENDARSEGTPFSPSRTDVK